MRFVSLGLILAGSHFSKIVIVSIKFASPFTNNLIFFCLIPKPFLAYSLKYLASKLAYVASGDFLYFSIPIISATELLDSLLLSTEGFNGSNFSAILASCKLIVIWTIFGFDLLPH